MSAFERRFGARTPSINLPDAHRAVGLGRCAIGPELARQVRDEVGTRTMRRRSIPFEAPEVVLTLEALRLGVPRHNRVARCFHEYVATLIYTGLRPSEAQGLVVRHVPSPSRPSSSGVTRGEEPTSRRRAATAWRRSTRNWRRSSHRTATLDVRPSVMTLSSLPGGQKEEVCRPVYRGRQKGLGDVAAQVMRASSPHDRRVPTHVASHALRLLRGEAPISDLAAASLLGHSNLAR